jgi:ariadne-1
MDDYNLLQSMFNLDLTKTTKVQQPFFCPVCYEETATWIGMDCGHYFCFDCYREHLKANVALGPDCIFTTCAMQGCKLIVPEQIFKELLS